MILYRTVFYRNKVAEYLISFNFIVKTTHKTRGLPKYEGFTTRRKSCWVEKWRLYAERVSRNTWIVCQNFPKTGWLISQRIKELIALRKSLDWPCQGLVIQLDPHNWMNRATSSMLQWSCHSYCIYGVQQALVWVYKWFRTAYVCTGSGRDWVFIREALVVLFSIHDQNMGNNTAVMSVTAEPSSHTIKSSASPSTTPARTLGEGKEVQSSFSPTVGSEQVDGWGLSCQTASTHNITALTKSKAYRRSSKVFRNNWYFTVPWITRLWI